MTTTALVILAFMVGAVLAWVVSNARARAQVAAAEAREAEVRQQLQAVAAELNTLRERLAESEKAKVAAETRIRETEKNLAEQKLLLEDAKTRLAETFKSLAAEALAGNTTGFLTLAEEKFKALKGEAAGDLESRQKAIESLLQPLAETLSAYQRETRGELGSVAQQLRGVAETQAALQSETAKLVNALRSPQVRGRWGEIALRKTAELAGMSAHCDFVEQVSVETPDGRLRPDMVVTLPAGREIVVDSKVALDGYLEALEAKTDEAREAALTKHAWQVKQHVLKLASKEYWDQFPAAPEFVVLFIPNDSFLAAAAEKDPNLIESALTRHIVIATPTTFIALLRAIAYGWKQEAVTENAQRISDLGQELYERMATLAEHISKVGGSLGKAVDSYNAAVASLEMRVLPSARRFKELGAGGKKDLEELQPVDQMVRALPGPDKTG